MTKRGMWADHPELLQERSRHGVIKAGTLTALGMSSKTIWRRCQPGGPWQRLLPGIILLHNGKPTQDERVIAALLYAGPESVVTGVEACRRQGLRPRELPPGDGLHMLVQHEHKILSAEFVTVERTTRLPRPVVRDEVPLAPLVRATMDTARRLHSVEPIGQLLIEAIQRGRCAPEALRRELDLGSPRGTAIPRRLLAEWADLRSLAEARAKELSRQLPIPPTHWNVELRAADGSYLGCPDAWWDDIALAWEIDSFEFHFYRAGYKRTLARNTRYATAGVTIVPTLPSRLIEEPELVLAELKAAYQAAAARPRPPITLAPQAA